MAGAGHLKGADLGSRSGSRGPPGQGRDRIGDSLARRNTPARRNDSDAVRFGRQHVRDGVGTIKTEKTDTEVTLPVLAKTLAAGPCGHLAFIANVRYQWARE
jgi:hypothetical protein